MTPPKLPPDVARVFESLPADVRPKLDRLRALIFAVAKAEGAGPVEEALRWGQPAYLVPKGSTIRLGQAKTGDAALFVNCRTSLIEGFRPIAPPGTRFESTRAVLFGRTSDIDEAALAVLIARALTYHRGRRKGP